MEVASANLAVRGVFNEAAELPELLRDLVLTAGYFFSSSMSSNSTVRDRRCALSTISMGETGSKFVR